jgi:hypothetical protein
MSTRSIIARRTGNGGWEGRYHHWDGYPEGVGATLFSAYNGHFEKDADAMLKYLVDDHPAGWSTINGADFSMEPGFNGPGPSCYCHGDRSEEGFLITSEDESCAGAEYVYVVDVEDQSMTVLERAYRNGERAVQFFGIDAADVAEGVHWRAVAVVDLNGIEPPWERMGG